MIRSAGSGNQARRLMYTSTPRAKLLVGVALAVALAGCSSMKTHEAWASSERIPVVVAGYRNMRAENSPSSQDFWTANVDTIDVNPEIARAVAQAVVDGFNDHAGEEKFYLEEGGVRHHSDDGQFPRSHSSVDWGELGHPVVLFTQVQTSYEYDGEDLVIEGTRISGYENSQPPYELTVDAEVWVYFLDNAKALELNAAGKPTASNGRGSRFVNVFGRRVGEHARDDIAQLSRMPNTVAEVEGYAPDSAIYDESFLMEIREGSREVAELWSAP